MQLTPFQRSRSRARFGWLALLLLLAWAGHGILAADAPPNFVQALAAQYEMVAERPYDPTVQNDLGNLLMLADREAEAEEAYRQALEIDATHRAARFNLALLLQSRNEHSEAVKHLARLVELAPRHAWAHYQKGTSHERLGERKAAIRHYARSFTIDPGLTFAENNPQIIDSELTTQALLVSGRHAAGETRRVPRQYDEAGRIADLMLQRSEAGAESPGAPDPEAEFPDSEVEVAPEAMDVEAPATGGGRPGRAEPLEREPDAENGDDEPAKATGEGDDDGEKTPVRRVITADDLESGRSGGVVEGGGQAQRPDLRQPNRGGTVTPQTPRRDRPPSVTDRGSGNTPQGTTRYRPSRRSSASLELKLLPENETVSAG